MYDFAINPIKLQRAITAVGNDPQRVLEEYTRIGGKVSENYKLKKTQHAEPVNKSSSKSSKADNIKQDEQEQDTKSALAKFTLRTAE